MIINTNIAALNSYRNLVSTENRLNKSLERLSSGLRINRASDDAAGLAISEKMRGQIRGLAQAIRNAQDGISLIQTAEGALDEVHGALQRMRELAVQAANDTLTSNDRMEIQHEIDQLVEEINRISNNTEFNTKNLLDGTTAAISSVSDTRTQVYVRDGLRVTDKYGQKRIGGGNYELEIEKAEIGDMQVQKTNVFRIKHSHAQYAEVPETGPGSYNTPATMDSRLYDIDRFWDANGNYILQEPQDITIVQGDGEKATITLYGGDTVKDLVDKLNDAIHNDLDQQVINAQGVGNEYARLVGGANNSAGLYMEVPNNDGFFIELASGGVVDRIDIATGAAPGITVTVSGVDDTIYVEGAHEATYEEVMNAIRDHASAAALLNIYIDNADFNEPIRSVTPGAANLQGINELLMPNNDDLYVWSDHANVTLEFDLAGAGNPISVNYATGAAGHEITVSLAQDADGNITSTYQDVRDAIEAHGIASNFVNMFFLNEDNSVAAAGGPQALVENADLELLRGEFEDVDGTVVIHSAISGSPGDLHFLAEEPVLRALGLTTVQDSSETRYTVNIYDAHDSDPNRTALNTGVVTGNLAVGLLHENVDVRFFHSQGVTAEFEFGAFNASHKEESVFVHMADSTMVMQVGANPLQEISAAIGNMGSNSLGVGNVLVFNPALAGRAIDQVSRAIDQVSNQRSRLGAVYNRLEHTINNLGVSMENLQASESRIRDTDMAQEMMEFTRNQIMMQSGMAMLAQANLKPQSVLMLLG